MNAISCISLLLLAAGLSAQPGVSIDLSKQIGKIRPLNGINIGTVDVYCGSELTEKYNDAYRELKIPLTRLHDCHYPYPDVVDIPAIFPLFNKDADDSTNYNFSKTDNYLLELLKTGTAISYRLGVSIEHTKKKFYAHPPEDFDKWARICVNIIRHYNEGWNNGYHLNIRYWEIWNEAEIEPMWSGTIDQYIKLYETAARAIKKHDPSLKVGPEGSAGVFKFKWSEPILAYCSKNSVPVDFFPWHSYTGKPYDIVNEAVNVRKLLDQYGFVNTESHLNEWNYVGPDMGKMPTATFTATTLINLQDLPVDQACHYAGNIELYGIFEDWGEPKKTYYSLKAFSMMLDAPERVKCSVDTTLKGINSLGGMNAQKDFACVMISNYNDPSDSLDIQIKNIPWKTGSKVEIYLIDEKNNLNSISTYNSSGKQVVMKLKTSPLSVLLIKLMPITNKT